jgi:class 3 adenylate cyclase/pimeloyl-ACP methyl ester carboxylesterase
MRDVEVDYAVRDGASIAYEVFGNGPVDLVTTSSRFPIDLMWDLPQLADFLDSLGQVARVIAYDARGTGASDPLRSVDGAAGIESMAADMLAVLDAAGCDRVSIMNLHTISHAVFFAATYPERVRSLILGNLRPNYPELRGFSLEQRKKMARSLATARGLRSDNPRVAHDPALQRWWGRARRLGSSPEETARQMEFAADMDIESVLGSVRAPTLVLHRRDNKLWDIETSRAAAARIPDARFVELPGSELDYFLGDVAPVLGEIIPFLQQEEATVGDDRQLATVLFTDIAASTERLAAEGDLAWRRVLDEHDDTIGRTVAAYRGRIIKTLGDGILATFDGPARAVRCAAAIRDTLADHGIPVRAGLHTGEIELRGGDIAGIAVHIASRISALADPGQILVSRTVVDLTAGSGITYDGRGDHELKGVPGTVPIFTAKPPI